MKCCINKPCLLKESCAVVGCILGCHLIVNEAEKLYPIVQGLQEKYRHKYIIDVLQEKQPPKVRKTHINSWWGIKYLGGIDLDYDEVPKKLLRYHRSKKHTVSKKPYSLPREPGAPFKPFKTRKTEREAHVKKENPPVSDFYSKRQEEITRAKYVNYLGKECPCVGFISSDCLGAVGVKKYQDVYYYSAAELYIFKVEEGIRVFPKSGIGKFIKNFFPEGDGVKLSVNTNLTTPPKEPIGQVVARMLSAPEQNFHQP